jgi:proline iminopeptidase
MRKTTIWATLVFLTVLLAHSPSLVADALSAEAAVAIAETIAVTDAHLYLEVRGQTADAPLLLWLHGGPGGAERPLFRYFNSDLEQKFLVVYLDQRGAGKSYDPDADPKKLTVARHLSDLDAIIDRLLLKFSRKRIILIGHSWGGMLGLMYAKAHADKVSALICVVRSISAREQQSREYSFDLAEATRQRDQAVLSQLARIGKPPFATTKQVLDLQRVTEAYRGVHFKAHNRFVIVVEGIFRGLVTPWELSKIFEANDRSLAAMMDELWRLDLRSEVRGIEAPVAFFLGRHDHHVDANLAAEYFEVLNAPSKQIVWFEQSAHDVPFDEPNFFNASVVSVVQKLTAGPR